MHKVSRSLRCLAVLVICCATGSRAVAQTQPSSTAAAQILRDLRAFKEFSSVLYVAAHPDDENTQLIAYLAGGRHSRTAYLSVTRGDGGQNVLGPEFGEELGVIRTQELLAARRIDGGCQFFTTALDFGFSKHAAETLKVWNRNQVVEDIVRVIRTFRPDVVITRFNPDEDRTHGHHTSSAILTREAFKLAGDAKAFPDQLTGEHALMPWQPKRILMNGRGDGNLSLDISGTDEVTGKSYLELAGRSRSMHKSQGFGNFGGGGNRGGRTESFSLLAGEPASKSIFDDVDTTWNRVPGGAEIDKLTADLIEHFDANNLDANVPAILAIRAKLVALAGGNSPDPVVLEKRGDLDSILQKCLGLTVQTTMVSAEAVPGEAMKLHFAVVSPSKVPIHLSGVSYFHLANYSIGPGGLGADTDLQPGKEAFGDATVTLPLSTPISQPYWLRERQVPASGQVTPGMFSISRHDQSLIGQPENPPAFPISYSFKIANQELEIPDVPVQAGFDPAKPETRRRLEAIPAYSIRLPAETELFSPGQSKSITVEAVPSHNNVGGTIRLEAPADWKIEPASVPLRAAFDKKITTATFTVTAPKQPGRGNLSAVVEVAGTTNSNQRIEIRYPHIPFILLQPPAQLNLTTLSLATKGKSIGYIPGAGDSVAECMAQMGCSVTTLKAEDLTPDSLKQFDAIVIGVRAFNVRSDLQPHMKDVFAWIESGGNLIVQYNRPGQFKTQTISPYSLQIGGDRVTDETAAVKFLTPDHPVLNTPNKITPADFDGWVQERGIYFPSQWDSHFTPILSMGDPGEDPLTGSLLIANYGKGHYIYTGLVFFRELPAGVPGAYRLLANLISLGR